MDPLAHLACPVNLKSISIFLLKVVLDLIMA